MDVYLAAWEEQAPHRFILAGEGITSAGNHIFPARGVTRPQPRCQCVRRKRLARGTRWQAGATASGSPASLNSISSSLSLEDVMHEPMRRRGLKAERTRCASRCARPE